MRVFGSAFSVSESKVTESDTVAPPGRYNQTSGKNIEFQFADDKLSRITVDDNAMSLYFLFDDRALNGVRKESGDKIIIDFEDGKARYVRTLKGVEGTLYPEKYVTGKESSYNLQGFFWETTKPVQATMPDPFKSE
jgi:hypothetical protein